jgi:hypothetical protein
MPQVKVATFSFLQGVFTLPGISSTAGHAHIRGDKSITFDLPNDAVSDGLLAFTF